MAVARLLVHLLGFVSLSTAYFFRNEISEISAETRQFEYLSRKWRQASVLYRAVTFLVFRQVFRQVFRMLLFFAKHAHWPLTYIFLTAHALVSKTKHSKTKTEARRTQISKTKHPKLKNGAPKTRKRSTQISKTKYVEGPTTLSLAWRKPNQVEATDESAPSKVHQSIPRTIWFLACRGGAISIFSRAFLSCHPFVYVSLW